MFPVVSWGLSLPLSMLLLSGCAVNPVTGKSELAFYQMSEAQEIALGKKAFPEAVQQMQGEYDDPALKAYVSQVGSRLAKISHRPHLAYEFMVVNESKPNAFALPGGHIAITRGLLVDLESESQLAAVLGHEIGHVTARHAAQNLQRGILLSIGLGVLAHETSGVSYGAVARQAGEIAGAILNSSYSRDQEREADKLGIEYMAKAFYSPVGAIELQQYFYKKSGEKEPMWIEGLLRTHPFSKERMRVNQAFVESRYGRTRNNPAYTVGKESFVQATASLRKNRDAYDKFDQAKELERQNKLAEAIGLYRQAVKAAPEQGLLNSGLGIALLKNKQTDEARKYLERAVRSNAKYFEPYLGLGYIALKEGQDEAAESHLQKSMQLMPTLGGAYYLAEAYAKTGKYKQAYDLYGQVAGADPRGELGQDAGNRARDLAARFRVQ